MFEYLDNISDKEETFKRIKKDILELCEEIDTKEGLDKIPFLDFLGKAAYYKTLFNLYDMTKDESTFQMILDAVKADRINIETNFNSMKRKNEELEELKKSSDILITKKNEIIIFTRSEKFGYYIVINTPDILRAYNLTSTANGYHIFGTGNFCAGTTYRDLKSVLEKGEISDFIILLKKVLTDYDDGEQHAATEKDFDHWRVLQKELEKEELTEDTRFKQLLIFNKKLTYIEGTLFKENSFSEEAKEYILDKIDIFENDIRNLPFKLDS